MKERPPWKFCNIQRFGVFFLPILCAVFAVCVFFEVAVSAADISMDEALRIGTRTRNAAAKHLSFEHAKNVETQISGNKIIRVLRGQHLLLFTDLPPSKEVDRLPQIFDQAVPLWAEFFQLDPKLTENWKMIGVLVGDSKNFASTPLLKYAPNLRHGFSIGNWLWLRQQRSEYYQRHLLLHEGVHGFMNHFFGFCGPNWYMEGLAELLGTHHWNEKTNTLRLPYFPENIDAVPSWGRILLVQNMTKETPHRKIRDVMNMDFDGADDTQCYAQSWALCAFFNGHPRYREILRDCVTNVSQKKELTQRFLEKIESVENGRVHPDWDDFLGQLDFGYDFQRAGVDSYAPGKPLLRGTQRCKIRADQGWQNSSIQLEKGKTYSFRASGRFLLAKERGSGAKVWWSEPNGVTIRYHQGNPLGILLATVVSDETFPPPEPIGVSATWKSPATGTLFFRVNDSAAELDDNSGTVTVEIKPF